MRFYKWSLIKYIYLIQLFLTWNIYDTVYCDYSQQIVALAVWPALVLRNRPQNLVLALPIAVGTVLSTPWGI